MEREEIINLTRKLVEIPSVTGDRKEALRALEVVSETIGSNSPLVSKTFESSGIVSRIWGDRESLMSPQLLLCGHIDVVPADDPDQFEPKVKDSRMYGRGAGDMKGHVASMVAAYIDWLGREHNSKGLGLLLTADEERGGFNGARYIIEKQNLKPKTVIIPDGEFNFDICYSQKAPHHFHVLAKAEGAHVAHAYRADNPINRVIGAYLEMRKKYAVATREHDWGSTFELTVIQSPMTYIEEFDSEENKNIPGKQIDINKLLEDEKRVRRIISSIINTKQNSAKRIPSSVEAWFGWRWPLDVEIDGEKATLESGTKDMERVAKEFDLKILGDGHGQGEGCYCDKKAPFVQTWKETIESHLKRKIGFTYMHGATDGRHFYKYGSEVLTTSAITNGAHSIKEWVDINSLVILSHALSDYLKRIVRI